MSATAQDKVPARLYKYQPFTTQSITNLISRRVWFARPTSFNDPLDSALSFKIEDPTPSVLVEYLERYRGESGATREQCIADGTLHADGTPTETLKAQAVGNMETFLEARAHENRTGRGVTCFSEQVDNPLLWAHYGGGHRGFCLEFDTSTELFKKAWRVRYSNDWPRMDILEPWKEDTDGEHWLAGILTKAEFWAYEREWRALHLKPDHPYTYDWQALTGVYFGAMMDPAQREITAMILRDSGTKLFNMRHKPEEFTLEAAPMELIPFDYEADAAKRKNETTED